MINLAKFPVQVGKCIYCARSDGRLSDEHIVPFGLSGEWVLTHASCDGCSRITSDFERDVLRRLLLSPRTTLGLRTRRKHKRPSTIPVRIEREGSSIEIDLPLQKAPILAVCPIFDAPAHVSGKPYQEGIVVSELQITHVGPPPLVDVLRSMGTSKLAFDVRYKPAAFARMIAKIAYGFSVAQLGLDGLEHAYVLPAILGTTDDVGRWVGSLTGEPRNVGPYLHAVTLRVVAPELHAHVRLFAEYHFPEYEVVVGRLSSEGLGKLRKPKESADA